MLVAMALALASLAVVPPVLLAVGLLKVADHYSLKPALAYVPVRA